jgi:type II secretory pathway pseudopilin PulG
VLTGALRSAAPRCAGRSAALAGALRSAAPRCAGRSAALAGARRRRAGFSLVELIVAIGALGLVVFFTLGSFTAQHQTYVVVDQVSEAQQNTRAIASLLERDIRSAGYMVSDGAAVCGADRADAADDLYLSDADAILPIDLLPDADRSRDLGAEVQAGYSGGITEALTVDDVVLDGTASYDTDGDGVADSDFQVGGGAILADVSDPGRGVRCGVVTAVAPATGVTVGFLAGTSFGTGGELRLVPAHVYRVVDPGGGGPLQLQRDGLVLAKDVEDLQVAWLYDDDEDGQVDAGEYRGEAGSALDPTAVDGSRLRELRFNLVVRTAAEDPRGSAVGTGQSLENRTANLAADDGRRRRIHTSTVRVRNVAL